MIEPGPGPAVRGVTLLATSTEFSMVAFPVIVLAMTGVTLLGCFLVILVCMTGLALRFPVSTDQRKTGFPMIEPDFFPAFGNVTVVAHPSQATFMSIILAMTRVAVCWRRPKCLATRMAVHALDF